MIQELRLERHGEIATLVIDQPKKRNALSYGMWEALPELVASVDADDSVKVLVVRGAGQNFSAGADVSEFETCRSTVEEARVYGECVERARQSLGDMQKPSIAMIRGFCIGGGCELVLACDLRCADTTAQFAITSAKLGIVYGFASTRQLVHAVGPSFAKYLLISSASISAREALRVRLVDMIFESTALEMKTYEVAQTICSRSQVSVRASKSIINEINAGEIEPSEASFDLYANSVLSDDYQEGIRAFLEKRAPAFHMR